MDQDSRTGQPLRCRRTRMSAGGESQTDADQGSERPDAPCADSTDAKADSGPDQSQEGYKEGSPICEAKTRVQCLKRQDSRERCAERIQSLQQKRGACGKRSGDD